VPISDLRTAQRKVCAEWENRTFAEALLGSPSLCGFFATLIDKRKVSSIVGSVPV
jgi:hypothetical protein